MKIRGPSAAVAGVLALCMGGTAGAAVTGSAVRETQKVRPTDPPPPPANRDAGREGPYRNEPAIGGEAPGASSGRPALERNVRRERRLV